ncbi:hypothetical protein CRG98_024220 [Punica granatum]|uniref:Uncharacterized protein n=1 Tax=Punica granatum TaxID=22663 RepID=A0A2I0JGJ0_PUNGR|nr:hypothetical protein CRG98_024220 [Punica granatum]
MKAKYGNFLSPSSRSASAQSNVWKGDRADIAIMLQLIRQSFNEQSCAKEHHHQTVAQIPLHVSISDISGVTTNISLEAPQIDIPSHTRTTACTSSIINSTLDMCRWKINTDAAWHGSQAAIASVCAVTQWRDTPLAICPYY